MEIVRAFIALELTQEIHQQLAQIEDELKKSGADVKWVEPDGIHLTLRFLGNVHLDIIEKISKILDELTKECASFSLALSQLEAFPTRESPRVIWVGIERGKDETVKLAQDLEQRLTCLGFPRENRPFKPHLTLGRVRSAHNCTQLKTLLQSISFPQRTMQAKVVTLFKSTLTPRGAIYEPLYQAKLS